MQRGNAVNHILDQNDWSGFAFSSQWGGKIYYYLTLTELHKKIGKTSIFKGNKNTQRVQLIFTTDTFSCQEQRAVKLFLTLWRTEGTGPRLNSAHAALYCCKGTAG